MAIFYRIIYIVLKDYLRKYLETTFRGPKTFIDTFLYSIFELLDNGILFKSILILSVLEL